MTFVLDSANWYHEVSFSEEPDKLEAIEMLPSDNSYELRRAQIPDADVGVWSAKDSSKETGAFALLRLVGVRMHNDPGCLELNTRKSSLDTLVKNFELEKAFRYSFTLPAIFVSMPVCQTEHSDMLKFSLSHYRIFGIAWRHDARSGRTEGSFWGVDWAYEKMWHIMNRTKGWARHPLLLALVASVVIGYSLDKIMFKEAGKIVAVEARTGYHGFDATFYGIAEGDYTSLSQRMSGCAGALASVERDHKILNEFLSDISHHFQRYDVGNDPSSRRVRLEMEDCVEMLKRKSKMQKIQLDYLARRVGIQLTAVRDVPFTEKMSMPHLNEPC